MYVDKLPTTLRYSIHLDTAFKRMETVGRGDYSVICIWGHEPGTGRVFFVEGKRSNIWDSRKFTMELVEVLRRYDRLGKPVFVITDDRPGGKADTYQTYLTDACNDAQVRLPPFITVQTRLRLDVRIREAGMYWLEGKVRLLRNAPCVETLVLEMTRHKPINDDMADASANVFNPEVYTPGINTSTSGQIALSRPWDEFLYAPGPLRTEEAREIYDELVRSEELEKHFAALGGEFE